MGKHLWAGARAAAIAKFKSIAKVMRRAIKKSPTSTEIDTIRLPSYILLWGILLPVEAVIYFIRACFYGVFVADMAILAGGMLAGACFIVAYRNCTVRFEENGVVLNNFFGKKRRYPYSAVTGVVVEGDTILYVGKRKIVLDEKGYGKRELIKAARDAIVIQRNIDGDDAPGGKPLPGGRRRKKGKPTLPRAAALKPRESADGKGSVRPA
jgi:hypothetical protein